MATTDPYLQWLGIRSPERPPNHYRLLGIEPFESDASVIETAADRQMAHVRTFANGKDAELSQQILNELAAAKLCLLNGKTKFEYDSSLKQTYFSEPPPVDPATIDIVPTESRVVEPEDLATTVNFDIEVEPNEDSFQLARPKRGSRGGGRRLLVIATAISILVLAGIGYRLGPVSNWFADATQDDKSDTTEQNTGQDENTPAHESSDENDTDTPPLEDSHETSNGQNASADEPPKSLDSGNKQTEPVDEPNIVPIQPRTPTTELTSDPATPTEGAPDQASPAPWRRTPDNKPFVFQSGGPLESFAVALSSRDIDTARIILDSHKNEDAIGNRITTALEPIMSSHELFWAAVTESISELRMATELDYRGQKVQVIGRTSKAVQLKAKNGERKSFVTETAAIDADLASALVAHRFRQNPPVGWRLIASFLCVDRQGDVATAKKLWLQAERQGIAVSPDQRAFNFLEQIAGSNRLGEDDATADGSKIGVESKKRHQIPGKNATLAARRVVRRELDSFFRNRTKQGQTILAQELLRQTQQAEERPVYAYALLNIASDTCRELRRPDLLLESLVHTARLYEFDLTAGISSALHDYESVDEQRQIASKALDLGDAMIQQSEYAIAECLHDYAKKRLSSLPDLTLRVESLGNRISQVRSIAQDIPAAQRALASDEKDPQANRAVGLHYFVQREFDKGLLHLVRSDDEILQNVAMADIMASKSGRPNGSLASQWEDLAAKFSDAVRSSMLARAAYWRGE